MSCTVDLQIDPPSATRTVYVPLDIIHGRAIVKVNKEIAVTNIQIKLLGQTFTTITKQVIRNNGRQRLQTNTESHEVVYDVDTVFPPDEIKKLATTPQFTLIPGTYTYEFQFQLPLNATCGDPDSAKIYSNRLNSPIEKLHENTHNKHGTYDGRYVTHLVTPLPPSCKGSVLGLTGSDGYGVKYEVKCTVRRASMFKSNFREIKRIIVVPFEFGTDGLRSSDFKTDEVMVCSNAVSQGTTQHSASTSKSSSFKKFFKSDVSEISSDKTQLAVKVHVEFQRNHLMINTNPIKTISLSVRNIESILANAALKSNPSIYLRSLNITLRSQTNYRAQDFNGIESAVFPMIKLENINFKIPLISRYPTIPLNLTELFKDAEPLVPVVPPSFQACSILKGYWLEFTFQLSGDISSANSTKISYRTANMIVSSGIPLPPTTNINVNSLPSTGEVREDYQRPSGSPPTSLKNDAAPSYQSPSGPPLASSTMSPQIPTTINLPGETDAAREKREVEEWFAKNQHLYEQTTCGINQTQQSSLVTGGSTLSSNNDTPLTDFDTQVPATPSSSPRVDNSTNINQINHQLGVMGISDNNAELNVGEQLPSYQEATSRRGV